MKRSRSPIFSELKLEIDEGLEVGCDELVDDKDDGHCHQRHSPQGQHGKTEPIAAFETFRKPVDDHAYGKDKKDIPIVAQNMGYDTRVPRVANLVDHLSCGAPGGFVGLSGVEVGAATEEEPGEGDEDKGEENVPYFRYRIGGLRSVAAVCNGMYHQIAHHRSHTDNAAPDGSEVQRHQLSPLPIQHQLLRRRPLGLLI